MSGSPSAAVPSTADAERRRRLRLLGILLTLLSLAVVAVSAYLRLASADLGCAPWPECYAGFLAAGSYAPPAAGRLVHRVVATSALLLAIYACWQALRPRRLEPVARQALLLLGLMLFLSVVGIWSNDPRRVLVNFVNLVGGLGLVSMSWRIVLAAQAETKAEARRTDPLCGAGLAALTVTVLLGALIGARYAATVCSTLPDCGGAWLPAAGGLTALNPLTVLTGPAPAGDGGGVALHLLHRFGAVATLLLLGAAALRRCRDGGSHSAAMAVLALLGAEVLLGVLTVATGYHLWLAIGHNACAAALLAAAAQMASGAVPVAGREHG